MRVSTQNLLLSSVIILLMIGLVMVYSSSALIAGSSFHDSTYFLKRQLFYVGLGLGAILLGAHLDPDLYRHLSYPFYFASLVLLLLVLIPGVGKSVGGAARWIALGPIRFQAGEIFKFALVIYLAMSLAKRASVSARRQVGVRNTTVRTHAN